MAKPRGRQFKKGHSGNPAGRPKGSKTKPKETTMEQEAEVLQLRGIEHVIAGSLEAAKTAFGKMFAMSGSPATDADIDRLIETVQAALAKDNRIGLVQGLYDDEAEEGDGSFFLHVGLPGDATWEQFRAHYAVGEGDVDADRACQDLATYPPIAARVAELKAEQRGNSRAGALA